MGSDIKLVIWHFGEDRSPKTLRYLAGWPRGFSAERMFTWGGRRFGYKDGVEFWSNTGKQVGKFHVDEVCF